MNFTIPNTREYRKVIYPILKYRIMFENKKILITGGTGSLGHALTRRLLTMGVDTIRIFSRNESKQVHMYEEFQDKRLRFLIGDVRDLPRLTRAMEEIDIIFHAAALKHVPVVEYNPFEAIKTNIIGSQNVIDACLANDVEVAVCVGTDKAVSPLNTYGATKLLMEKLFVTASNYLNKEFHRTRFVAVRYGNVLGSSGSVVPKFIEQIKSDENITITDPSMTRFNITMDQALDFIFRAVKKGQSGEVFVPKLKAYKLNDMKDALLELYNANNPVKIISVRPGEKYHESLINKDELRYTLEDKDDYLVTENNENVKKRGFSKTNMTEQYSSNNVELITKEELKTILLKEKFIS